MSILMERPCLNCGKMVQKTVNESLKEWTKRRKFCNKKCFDLYRTGKPDPKMSHKHTEDAKERMSKTKIWKKATIETRRKMSLAWLKRVAEWRHNTYRNWATKAGQIIRSSLEYKLRRESVFKRDNWTCVWCGSRGVTLHADHIKPFSLYPELRFAIDNGRTLCVPCHKTTDTYMGKIQNYTPTA